jgi:hypothetical protein
MRMWIASVMVGYRALYWRAMNKAQMNFSIRLIVLLGPACFMLVPAAYSSDAIPKQVSLIVNGKRLVASNVRFSTFSETKLNAREVIEDKAEGKGVLVVVTNQRFIAYGLTSGWNDLNTKAGETVESLSVEDYAVFITTNMRHLNFNGETGVWGVRDSRVER